jgi:hypothetical protein
MSSLKLRQLNFMLLHLMLFDFKNVCLIVLHHVISSNFMLQATTSVVWVMVHQMLWRDKISAAVVTFGTSVLIDVVIDVLLSRCVICDLLE